MKQSISQMVSRFFVFLAEGMVDMMVTPILPRSDRLDPVNWCDGLRRNRRHRGRGAPARRREERRPQPKGPGRRGARRHGQHTRRDQRRGHVRYTSPTRSDRTTVASSIPPPVTLAELTTVRSPLLCRDLFVGHHLRPTPLPRRSQRSCAPPPLPSMEGCLCPRMDAGC